MYHLRTCCWAQLFTNGSTQIIIASRRRPTKHVVAQRKVAQALGQHVRKQSASSNFLRRLVHPLKMAAEHIVSFTEEHVHVRTSVAMAATNSKHTTKKRNVRFTPWPTTSLRPNRLWICITSGVSAYAFKLLPGGQTQGGTQATGP